MARSFEDLQCWRLANALRAEAYAICAGDRAAGNRRFCNSFTEAAGSVCRNISEGFARGTSADIVQFFRYALASLAEVQDHLIECKTLGALGQSQFEELWDLAEHTKATAINFAKPHKARLEALRTRKTPRST